VGQMEAMEEEEAQSGLNVDEHTDTLSHLRGTKTHNSQKW